MARSTPKKLPSELIYKLIEKAAKQNNKLTFEDITIFATTVENFTQKDFAVVMDTIKTKKIDLGEKLLPSDLAVKAEPQKAIKKAPEAVQRNSKSKTDAAKAIEIKAAAEEKNADTENPTDEELKIIDNEIRFKGRGP